jgi:hypothetical protein
LFAPLNWQSRQPKPAAPGTLCSFGRCGIAEAERHTVYGYLDRRSPRRPTRVRARRNDPCRYRTDFPPEMTPRILRDGDAKQDPQR